MSDRWEAFSTSELEDIAGAFSVADQEYGVSDEGLWQEIRDELLRREFPDLATRRRMIDWSDAITEDHRRFPGPLEALLRATYEPAMRSYLSSRPFVWMES